LIISVIGDGNPTEKISLLAEEVGTLLAKKGILIVCGGLGGVMESVCRGAKKHGGTTIGIIPGIKASEANQWVDIPICTGISQARNVIIATTGDAIIAVGGKYGTLSEISHALSINKPVIGLNTWNLSQNKNIEPSIIQAQNPADAVNLAERAILKND
jgi:uncharacterized protein (TIGR00725 family)